MPYVNPEEVTSPKTTWTLKSVIHNTGQGGWSAAEGTWDGEPCLAIRWNGSDSDSGVGSPQSRGYPTWFVVPQELQLTVRQQIGLLQQATVSCEITRPDGYDYGAWQITMTLSPSLLKKLGNNSLAFELPALPKRMCMPEKAYVRAIAGELCGNVVEGQWRGDIYSNGIPEDQNPTKIEAVRDAFVQSVKRALHQAELRD
ncbi:hypothetical protein [Cupriavidus sp. CuC1]|uniref:hypothetical protein n=1 Tax=Cupriavidus sp. CuC1 TaxID=3373131 RepID=UPI0037D501F0